MAGLHVLIVWAFIFQPPVTMAVQPVVQVRLTPPSNPPPLPPPPISLVAPQPSTIPPPLVTVARPPPPAPNAPIVTYGVPAPPAPPAPEPIKPSSDYLSRLVAYLNAYKNYPHDARVRREQGVVRLHFIMDRSGRVLSYNVVGSSGSVALDEAARDLIRRAQPLPPVPSEFPGATLELVVPVVFSLH